MHSIVEKGKAALQWFVAASLGMKVLVVAGVALALLIAVALPALVFLVALVTAIISGIVHLLRRGSGGGQRAGQLAVASTVTMVVFIVIAVASAPDTDEVADTQESGEEAAVQADADEEDARAEEEAAEEEARAEEEREAEEERQRIEEEEAEEERRAEEEAERQAEEEAAAEEERRGEEEERLEPEPEPQPEPETDEERAEQRLHEELGSAGFFGGGDSEWESLKEVELKSGQLHVHYDGVPSRRLDVRQKANIYEALYTADLDMDNVIAWSYADLVNTETGEESNEVVWRTSLPADQAADINWGNADLLEWDQVFETGYIHPVRVE